MSTATLKGKLELDIASLQAQLAKSRGEIAKFKAQAQKDGAGLGKSLFGGMGGKMTALAGTVGFGALIKRGMEFNQAMGDSEVAIANVVKKFQGLDDVAARNEAAKAMKAIVAMEPQSAASLQGLTEGFLATFAAAQSAGISVERNVELVGMMANALANANIPANQLSQELRSIMQGNITSDSALAKMLQISNADITKAKSAGNLYEMLIGKIGSLGVAGDTAGVAFSTLQSAVDKVAGALTKGLFDGSVQGAKDLARELEKNAGLFESLGAGARVGMSGTATGFVAVSDAMATLAHVINSDEVVQGGSWTETLFQTIGTRIEIATQALAELKAEAEMESMPAAQTKGGTGTGTAADPKAAHSEGELKSIEADLNRLHEARAAMAEKELQAYLDILPPNLKLMEVQRQILDLKRQSEFAGVGPADEAERLRIQQQIVDYEREERAIRKDIAADAERANASAREAIQRVKESIAKKNEERTDQRAALEDITAEVAILREQAAGHQRKAQAMRESYDLWQRTQQIMEQTNLSQEEALALAKEEASLKKRIAEDADGKGSGKIHGYSRAIQGGADEARARGQAGVDDARDRAKAAIKSNFGGLDAYDKMQKTSLRDTFKFPGLDAMSKGPLAGQAGRNAAKEDKEGQSKVMVTTEGYLKLTTEILKKGLIGGG